MNPSQHPADLLIHELIQTRRPATDDKVEQIIGRMSDAPFDERIVRVRVEDRGLSYEGRMLGARADSLFMHVVKRVVKELQWVGGTSAQQYLLDLHTAARAPSSRVAVFERRGGNMAAALSRTDDVLPPARRGIGWLPWLLVLYSADRGTIVSGYQVSGLETASIPEDALWLR